MATTLLLLPPNEKAHALAVSALALGGQATTVLVHTRPAVVQTPGMVLGRCSPTATAGSLDMVVTVAAVVAETALTLLWGSTR